MHLERFEVNVLAASSYPLRRLGRFDEAQRRLEAVFEHLKQLKFYPSEKIYPGSEAQEAVQALADFEADRRNLARAVSLYEELLKKMQPAKSGLQPSLEDAMHWSEIYSAVSVLYRRASRPDLAGVVEMRRRDLWHHWDQRLPGNPFVLRQLAVNQNVAF